MYQRKVDVDMLNADVSSVSPSSEQSKASLFALMKG